MLVPTRAGCSAASNPTATNVCASSTATAKIVRTARKDPLRRPSFETMFAMARNGASAAAIQLELSSRGYQTAPVKKDKRPRAFDVRRITQTLSNPIYAGYVTHRGKIVGEGDWPRYIEPEDWHALQARRAQYVATRRPAGRPPTGYLLTGLARCAVCHGSMQATTYRRHRKDGPRTRRYLCAAHREYNPASSQWCPAPPVPGELADRIVLGGLDLLLSDIDSLRGQLSAGRSPDTERLGKTAADAREEAAKCDLVLRRAQDRYAQALAEDDQDVAEIT